MNPKKIRVMYVVHSLDIGGLEKCVVDLVNGLDRNRFIPMICCLSHTGPSADKITQNDVAIFEMHKRPGNDPVLPLRLAALCHRMKVDVVHSGNWGTLLESFLAAKLARVPKIVHMEQGMELGDIERLSWMKKAMRAVIKRLCSLGTYKIVTVSQDLKDYVHETAGIKPDKIQVIYNSVDTDRYARGKGNRDAMRDRLGLEKTDVLIGSVGRLAEVKNFDCLIRAMAKVRKTRSDVKLIIVGDGPYRNRLQRLIDGLRLSETVTLLGQRSDIPDLLAAMDMYALTSIFEGISISILEAMAAGLPVVATDVGGNSEIVIHGRTGYLVPSDDDNQLAQRLVELAGDPDKRVAFARAAEDRVNRVFHNRVMVAAYSKIYET